MVYINDEYHFIFIENPKSGSTSILCALEKSLGQKITREILPRTAHMTSYEIKKMYPDKWEKYFKVTTFRDPFKRFCSAVNYEKHEYTDLIEHLKCPRECPYCITQDRYTRDCDFIINIDNIQQDYNTFCDDVGIKSSIIEHRNKSKKKKRFDENYLKGVFTQLKL